MRILFYLALAAIVAFLATGCATSKVKQTITAPDGTVTVTETESSGADAAALRLGTDALTILAPRPVIIREQKGRRPHSTRRYLAPWRAPQEIACRPLTPHHRAR